MKIAKTFKDAASQEIAWFNAMTAAKAEGFTHVVGVIATGAGFQNHYFKSFEAANNFSEMAKTKPEYWERPTPPRTINSALKQCWS